jgi:peptide chain release factor 2
LKKPRPPWRNFRKHLKRQVNHFDVASLAAQREELEAELNAPDLWSDVENATRLSGKLKSLTNKIDGYEGLVRQVESVGGLIQLCDEEEDTSFLGEIESEISDIERRVEALRLETLLKGPYDSKGAVLSLHAGAGGTEAQDWAQMLFRMYTRYCERHGYSVSVLDMQDGDEAGIKSVTFEISGENAYGYLKAERGVHRLVRISPFDSNARRHTSFSSLDVAPVLEDSGEVEINMEEVRVDTYRASGAGGQHVNRTDSAVRMTHLPTGIVVQCQNERSQLQNREKCLMMLRSKLAELKEREEIEKMSAIKGEMKKIEWGSQIRSYVFQPYTMVKDHRTGFEAGNVSAVMDGDIDGFITAYLQMS